MLTFSWILQSFGDVMLNFVRNVRIVDILDIAIIAVFLYMMLNWLRQSASQRGLISFAILIVIYIAARFSGMYLTELLLEGLFAIILIGVVVVFQSDIRRFFERLSSWSYFGSSSTTTTGGATGILTQAAAKMADKKTGALIVIRGKENWDRHMNGGIELNGQVTIPLLHSIFNKYAPGHDGAVLMEGNRITKFGVHLPLSTNLSQISEGGTRHTAALGISEQCDALVVVVSEERGAISVARDGQITQLEKPSDLKHHLDEFWTEYYESTSGSFTNWWKRRSLITALGSVILSFVLWLTFAYQSGTVVYRNYEVPIEYRNLQSSSVALQDSVPLQARVTLSGSDQAFRTFDENSLVISFDLASENFNDEELTITADDLNLPTDLNFFESSPPTLKLKPKRLSTVQMPVKITTGGQLRAGLQMISITASPSTVEFLADTTATLPDSIATDAVDLSSIQNSATIQKRLQFDQDKMKLPEQVSPQVYIKIEVQENSE